MTPLHSATTGGYLGVVSVLLDHGANIKAVDDEGNTPVHYALEQRKMELARLFFQQETKTKSTDGVTLLHVACTFGLISNVLSLSHEKNAIDPEITCDGRTPLHLACKFGHMQIVQFLSNQRANLNAKDKEGWTSIHLAYGNGHVDLARMLLDLGADVEAKQEQGWTPLHLASRSDDLMTVRLLVFRNANIDAVGFNGFAPLHIVCKYGCIKVAKFLLDEFSSALASVNARNEKNWTPLHVACKNGQSSIVRLLLERGADLAAQTNSGKNPEQVARRYNHTKIVELLADHTETAERLANSENMVIN